MESLARQSGEFLLSGASQASHARSTSESGANTVARMRQDLADAAQALRDFNTASGL